jgi:hypoxanthine phosphoribosyltransferase
MNVSHDIRQGTVTTLDPEGFEIACRRLMTLVRTDWHPDVFVGIRTGGCHVAEVMARAFGSNRCVLPITCRRPSTRFKLASSYIRKLVSKLPRPIVDRLRVAEHKLLTRRASASKRPAYQFDAGEIAELDLWLEKAGRRPSILVVDDSVDTGNTLIAVLGLMKEHALDADIRSAVITITTSSPLITPDYTLFRQRLCRFPWSLDAQIKPAR